MRFNAIKLLLLSVFLVSFLSMACAIGAEPNLRPVSFKEGKTIADAFTGEELVYQIGIWFFDEVAIGKVSLRKDGKGDYVAVLTAYTTGVVDKVIKHRKDTYVSRMRLAEGGKRFVTLSFEKTIDTGDIRRSVTKFDYDRNVMTWRSWGGGKEEKSGAVDLPKGIYCDDPIAAFYNFRYGVYGSAEKGREYWIYSFPKEDHIPKIYLRIATDEEMDKRLDKPVDYLADAKIDKELFGSKSGELEIVFTREMVPTEAVAKGLIFFGDVRGRLVAEGVNTGREAPPEAAGLQ